MTGYSEKSLPEKLGLKDGMSTFFSHAPTEYFEALGQRHLTFRPDDDGVFEFIHAFFTDKVQLEASSSILVSKLADNGMLWVSWPRSRSSNDKSVDLQTDKTLEGSQRGRPKKTSNLKTDISEQDLRDILLPLGVVDTKVCAVTEVWSGLKFVWRNN